MITAVSNQSLLDIAIQEDGNVLAAFDWALANGVSITDTLAPGQKLNTANSSYKNADVAKYFKGKSQMVATALNNNELIETLGIGTMAIESTFIVR
ncbi:hypothetical protein [Flavobacterium sp.]|uniref:hypothetical protein n=1 Tax=Flavobacterium sp. TaxID=239 RepID=UPI00262E8BC5|nr:hypothetical protein [Flavobacterium sp.]